MQVVVSEMECSDDWKHNFILRYESKCRGQTEKATDIIDVVGAKSLRWYGNASLIAGNWLLKFAGMSFHTKR